MVELGEVDVAREQDDPALFVLKYQVEDGFLAFPLVGFSKEPPVR